jgi:hypothetical protein
LHSTEPFAPALKSKLHAEEKYAVLRHIFQVFFIIDHFQMLKVLVGANSSWQWTPMSMRKDYGLKGGIHRD